MTKQRHPEYTCSMQAALSVLSGKWKVQILTQLMDGPTRYSELHRRVSGITEKMLSQQLRELEEDKIIQRKIYPEVPPRVEYSFTELGLKLSAIFYALEKWGADFLTVNQDSIKVADESCYTFRERVMVENS
ncbi:winged helix-turn-helix transcriptional regulator [Mucilaginibacter calamicampi]|uniref:Winged helix-turn-helix transcriptional regulator n=1 Tax=Mucilaginibacter calamicampi TaxID=1302352 RepID=A0ABW2YTQ4_9SPHI